MVLIIYVSTQSWSVRARYTLLYVRLQFSLLLALSREPGGDEKDCKIKTKSNLTQMHVAGGSQQQHLTLPQYPVLSRLDQAITTTNFGQNPMAQRSSNWQHGIHLHLPTHSAEHFLFLPVSS